MKFINKKKRWELISLTIILIFVLINTIWIVIVKAPPIGTHPNVATRSIEMAKHLQNGKVESFFFELTRTNYDYRDTPHPPLTLILFTGFYLIFGFSTHIELIINSLFLFVLLFSTYKLTETLYGKRTGIIAVLLLNSFYMTQFISKLLFLDFQLAAIVALTTYLLFKTDSFTNKSCSMLFGLSLGLASLTRYSFFIFLFPATIYFAWISLMKNNSKKKNISGKHMLTSVLIFLTISGIWYIPLIGTYAESISHRLLEKNEDSMVHLPIFSAKNVLLYPSYLINYCLGALIFILSFISFIIKIKNRPNTYEKTLMIIFFFSILILTFIVPLKYPAYLMPVIFINAIFLSNFFMDLKLKKRIKNIFFVIIVCYSAYCTLIPFTEADNILLFKTGNYQNWIVKQDNPSMLGSLKFQKNRDYEWIIETISAQQEGQNRGEKPPMVFIGEWTNIYSQSIEYYSLIHDNYYPYFYYYFDVNQLKNFSVFSGKSNKDILKYIIEDKPEYTVIVIGNEPSENPGDESILEKFVGSDSFTKIYETVRIFDYTRNRFIPPQKMIFFKKKEFKNR